MPFGDPRPTRRRSPKSLSRGGPGQKATTTSRHPDCLKAAKIVADCLEVTPRIMNPLEVVTGAQQVEECDVPKLPLAVIDVLNREDGHEYQIMVVRKNPSTNSR